MTGTEMPPGVQLVPNTALQKMAQRWEVLQASELLVGGLAVAI